MSKRTFDEYEGAAGGVAAHEERVAEEAQVPAYQNTAPYAEEDTDDEYDSSDDIDPAEQAKRDVSSGVLPKAATIRFGSDTGDDEYDVLAIPRRDAATGLFGKGDYNYLKLKPDHESRPLFICPNTGHIILEAFSPIAEQAIDFLIAISEPISRPTHLHEYKLTAYSLYAAVSVGLDTADIIEVLNRLSKVPVPPDVIGAIKQFTVSYGKVKLVLNHNRYYVESSHPEILQHLLRDPVIAAARIYPDSGSTEGTVSKDGIITQRTTEFSGVDMGGLQKAKAEQAKAAAAAEGEEDADAEAEAEKAAEEDFAAAVLDLDKDDEDEDAENFVHAFEIANSQVESVKKRCNEMDYPMLEEYDFRNDTLNPNLNIDLKPVTSIRPYQEKSLSKMFGNGRARSGIIVLPCGAGKTLVGITAACTVKKSIL
ncbi:DNA repair helicase RAD25, partial [Linderina pennispora]